MSPGRQSLHGLLLWETFLQLDTMYMTWGKRERLKETKTHISSYFYCKVLTMVINHWKFEQNRAKNKEVTAFSNLVNTRGR